MLSLSIRGLLYADVINSAWKKHAKIERDNPVRRYEGEKFRRI